MPTSQMRRLLCSRWPWLRLTAKFWARDSSCNKALETIAAETQDSYYVGVQMSHMSM